jgi:ankyrin repeat protein
MIAYLTVMWNFICRWYSTPLHYAAWNGHLNATCLLLELGADVNSWSAGDWRPLHRAVQTGHEKMAQFLVMHGKVVLLKIRFFEVAKFTTLTSLSLLASCRISLPITGLKVSSLPTFALKSPSKIFIWYLGN